MRWCRRRRPLPRPLPLRGRGGGDLAILWLLLPLDWRPDPMHTLFGLDEATLINFSSFCYFAALMAYVGLLVAAATQLSRRQVLVRETAEFGGLQPVFALAGA